MIEVKSLSKSFDSFPALDALTLTVPTGSVYGLVGPNGAGKSTLIRHLTGIYRADAGEALLDGAPIFENEDAKARIAYIPDEIFFWSSATLGEMMRFTRETCPHFSMERYEKLREAFPFDEKRPLRKFSKGMQKQAAFYLALCRCPEVLILDEPIDGLDPVMRRQVWSLVMQDVAERGTTVLVSSHNLREMEDVCDRVGIMNQGRMLLERSLAELQENLVKVQLALPEGHSLPEGLQPLHVSQTGRMVQLILRCNAEEAQSLLAPAQPYFIDILPLTLEEIFIYELGGTDHAIHEILL